jgi:hypothetical protein
VSTGPSEHFVGSFGYIPNQSATAAFDAAIPRIFGDQLDALPYDLNKTVIMYRHVVKTLAKNPKLVAGNRLRSRNQANWGSCVGHGGARSGLFTASADIWVRKEPEAWPLQDGLPVDVSPSAAYAMSRQITNSLGGGQGSYGAAMMRAMNEWGNAWEIKTDKYDLREYSTEDCSKWQNRGVPDVIIADAKQHPCRAYVKVRRVEQAVALVQNGYGMHMCSGYGWERPRDEDGFVQISGNWPHCQFLGLCYVVYNKNGRFKRGIGCQNSWGDNWKLSSPLGTLTPDLPFGSYIIWLEELEQVIRSGELYGVGDYQGFKMAPLNWEKALGF